VSNYILNGNLKENDHGSRPRNRWIDGVTEDWHAFVQDREKWRNIVVTAKTLSE